MSAADFLFFSCFTCRFFLPPSVTGSSSRLELLFSYTLGGGYPRLWFSIFPFSQRKADHYKLCNMTRPPILSRWFFSANGFSSLFPWYSVLLDYCIVSILGLKVPTGVSPEKNLGLLDLGEKGKEHIYINHPNVITSSLKIQRDPLLCWRGK